MPLTADQAAAIADELAEKFSAFEQIKGYFAMAMRQVENPFDLPSVWLATQKIIESAADKALRSQYEIHQMIGERIWHKLNP